MAARGLHVIAGIARGRRLRVPRGDRVRPTSGRVKEAMFSALDARDRLVGARVLDLFAGSGALGIEALSRGATSATFVERDPDAITAIVENLHATGFDDRSDVQRRAVGALLGDLRAVAVPYDLVFADPPYDLGADALADVLARLAASSWIAPRATVVVEHGRAPDPVPGLRTTWERRFGDTLVIFLEPEQSGTPAS
ncbi:MAG TPA: 16S rRNA (guanine(966)-N(2))-methyltransferase RsmD [Acidimicrobiia bacterium]|nr:16S rRNA (guanine(966)-N(2))-methyltransferase RsmD [Acidimicrobiia bacterium]